MTTGAKLGLVLLVLVVLLDCPQAAVQVLAPDDVPSLSLVFSVSACGPSWYVARGKINGTLFFKYTNRSLKAKPVGPLGMMLSATESWSQLAEHWKDLMEELRKALLDNQQNISKGFDSLSLQGSLMCKQKFSGQPSAFWGFGFNGQKCLHFYSKKRHWTELHPGCRSLKETLESDRYVTNLLVGISHGDCGKLLNQSTVLDTEEDASPKLLRVWPSSARVPSGRPPFHHLQVLT